MFVASVKSSPRLELVTEQPSMGNGDKVPHESRLSSSFKADALGLGVMSMDKDDHTRLSWKGWLAIAAFAALLVVTNWISHSAGVNEGQTAGRANGVTEGIVIGREQREKEFILENLKQLNNIKTAQQLFPDDTPKQEKK